jgi:peptidoglycan/LPS O-acetylase OafA/YrhL
VGREESYRPDVQALRGVAVLLVVAFHAWPGALPGGYVGVDVFFVISGYLITRLLRGEIEATGRIDFRAFYARRIRRLLPAAALVIVTTTVLVTLSYSPLEVREFAPTAIAAAVYLSNVWFAFLSVDYLQEGVHRNLLLHTWSLGVEEQFYVVWPLLIAASALPFRSAGGLRGIAWMVAGVCVLSFGCCLWLTITLQNWAFFSLPTRAWELGVGAAATLLERRARALDGTTRRAIVLAGLLCILTAGFAFSARTRFPGYAALLPVAGAFMIVIAGAADAGARAVGVLRSGPLRRIGDLSYSWYLWHWPVLILVFDRWPTMDRNVVAIAGVGVSLGLARLTYVFVENPVRNHPALRARPARAFVVAMLLTIGTVSVVGVNRFAASRGDEAGRHRTMEQAAMDRPRLYGEKCFASALETDPRECVYGAANGKRTITLIGDSHAAQWFPAIEQLALARGLRLAVFVKAACPFAEVEPFDPKLNRSYVECTQWRERVFQRIAQQRPVLVIAANSSFYDAFVGRDSEAQARWRRGLEASLDKLGRVSGHVAVIRDTPRPGFHVPACLARADPRGGKRVSLCTFRLSESMLADAVNVERAAAGGRANVSLIDLTEVICASATCEVERDGVVLFHDSQHLSATFVRSLTDTLLSRLPDAARADLGK